MSTRPRPTKRWAAAAIAAATSAVLAAPTSLGTASATTTTTVRPYLTITDIRPGVISLHAVTDPALSHATIYFYKIKDGERRVIAYAVTGRAGHAHRRIHLPAGTVHKFVAKAVGLNNRHRFTPDTSTGSHFRSKLSNRVTYRIPG